MSQTSINSYEFYFARESIQSQLDQLEETVAIAPNIQTTNALASWNTSATGPSSDHNLLNNTTVLLDPVTGDMSQLRSVQFTNSTGPTGLYSTSGSLYYNGVILGLTGDVAGPDTSTVNAIARFSDTTGNVIKDSVTRLVEDITTDPDFPIIQQTFYHNGDTADKPLLWVNSYNGNITSGSSMSQVAFDGSDAGVGQFVNGNIGIGRAVFQNVVGVNTFMQNTIIGDSSTYNMTEGQRNTAIGSVNISSLTSGSYNTVLGYDNMSSCTTGDNNIVIGNSCAGNWTSNESDNICIGNNGVTGDQEIIRIGDNRYERCHIGGIYNTIMLGENLRLVAIDDTDQLVTTGSVIPETFYEVYTHATNWDGYNSVGALIYTRLGQSFQVVKVGRTVSIHIPENTSTSAVGITHFECATPLPVRFRSSVNAAIGCCRTGQEGVTTNPEMGQCLVNTAGVVFLSRTCDVNTVPFDAAIGQWSAANVTYVCD